MPSRSQRQLHRQHLETYASFILDTNASRRDKQEALARLIEARRCAEVVRVAQECQQSSLMEQALEACASWGTIVPALFPRLFKMCYRQRYAKTDFVCAILCRWLEACQHHQPNTAKHQCKLFAEGMRLSQREFATWLRFTQYNKHTQQIYLLQELLVSWCDPVQARRTFQSISGRSFGRFQRMLLFVQRAGYLSGCEQQEWSKDAKENWYLTEEEQAYFEAQLAAAPLDERELNAHRASRWFACQLVQLQLAACQARHWHLLPKDKHESAHKIQLPPLYSEQLGPDEMLVTPVSFYRLFAILVEGSYEVERIIPIARSYHDLWGSPLTSFLAGKLAHSIWTYKGKRWVFDDRWLPLLIELDHPLGEEAVEQWLHNGWSPSLPALLRLLTHPRLPLRTRLAFAKHHPLQTTIDGAKDLLEALDAAHHEPDKQKALEAYSAFLWAHALREMGHLQALEEALFI